MERENESLKAEHEALKIENAELKERLGLNSKNSSIPSSKELYKMKKEKPKSERKIGGQVGHRGNYRAKMEADEVIKIEFLRMRREDCNMRKTLYSSESRSSGD